MKKKIVMIEDDKVLSNVLFTSLSDAGFDVYRAYDGEEGLKLAQTQMPDLVLLDIILPKVDGLRVGKKLKSDEATKDIPIIILTVLEKSEPLAQALESGVYEYIVKSDFKVEDIVARIKEKLGDSK
jgi:DNA-binding response OmpR family regulator